MFNVGSEDKEKLRENMEEIKNLIQGKGDNPNEPQPASLTEERSEGLGTDIEDEGFENSEPLENNTSTEPSLEDSTSTGQQFEESNDPALGRNQQSQSNFDSELDSQSEELGSRLQNDDGLTQEQEPNPVQERDTRQVVNQSEPEQNDQLTSQNNSNEVSQRLFLEVERFEKVKEMIDEMQQLTEDIETTSEDLEEQIGEERESEETAQQLLNKFNDRKREVEDVIVDSEEN